MRKLTPLLMAALLVAGCASAPEVPPDNFYRLQIQAPEQTAETPDLDGIVEVQRFAADGLTAGRPIVYSDSAKGHELHEYHYHFWTQPPTVMLRDGLVTYLRAANTAAQVVTPEMRVTPDYVITGRILRLERVVGDAPGAVVEVELALRKVDGDELMLLQTYRRRAENGTGSVGDTVAVINRALADIFGRFAADVRGL